MSDVSMDERIEAVWTKRFEMQLAALIKGGSYSAEERDKTIAEFIAECPEEEQGHWTERARRLVDEQAADELTWTDPTTNDRIAEAFKRLDELGIIALPNAGFTQSEAWTAAHEVRKQSMPDARGCVFFTSQDLLSAVAGKGLTLGFGAFYDEVRDDDEMIAVGREIVRVLQDEGVSVTWPEDLNRRIQIDPFQWRQRLGQLVARKTKADEYMPRPVWQR